MNTAFPLIAIAVAIAALALSFPPESKPPSKGLPISAILLILISAGSGFFWKDGFANALPAGLAFAGGVLLSVVFRFVEGMRVPSAAAALGFAAAISGFAGWLDPSYAWTVQLAAIAGLAFGAWSTASLRDGETSLPLSVATFTSVIVAADFIGLKALNNEPGGMTGTMFGLAAAIAALIGLLAGRSDKKTGTTLGFMPGMIGVVLLLVLGYVVGGRLVESKEAWMIFDGAVLAAAVLHWVIRPDGKDDSFAFLIASVIWIGIATLAFSFLKGYGMAIASAGAVLTLLMLGNVRALLSAGPLVGLAFYRVLRESHPDAVRALDIGQHYAVIGVAFGVVAALLPGEWIARRSKESIQTDFGKVLWTLVLCLIPVAMAVVLGAKGMVGFVVGLGLAAFVEGLRGGRSLLPILFAGGLSAIVAVSYGWLTNLLDMTREGKQTAFYWMAGVALVLGVLIALVTKPDSEPTTELS
ncbi:MAG: hypothetical protein H7Y17_11195 [Chlorobia bacterium]|nr:hypothetical protein [Fimbriimonadaceae bacterium]